MGGLIWGPAIDHGIQNPWKRRTKDDVVQETPKGPNFGNRHRAQPRSETTATMRSKGNVNESLKKALIRKIVK
jgi:hypothetical protein